MSRLATRLEDIPGVAAVLVDLDDDGGGINIKLVPGADESEVMDRLRTVLISYGVRPSRPLPVESLPGADYTPPAAPQVDKGRVAETSPLGGVKIRITPLERGARVEAESRSVRSFRIVTTDRQAIAQGVADAWCQVVGRVPVELASVDLTDGVITVVARGPEGETVGSAGVEAGWQRGLALAVGRAIGTISTEY